MIEKLCGCLLSAEERAQKENSAAIDNGLKKQKMEMDKELKLLLLGNSNTIFIPFFVYKFFYLSGIQDLSLCACAPFRNW